MNRIAWITFTLLLAPGLSVFAGAAPQAEITNRALRVNIYLPDAEAGFYRGTRFDWSGMIGALEFAGHDFYPRWFQRVDPGVSDFIYDGDEIVASPCTAATGPAEEFVTEGKALGFDEARPGGTFIKIGVGVLRRPDDAQYNPYRLYPIADGGKWTVSWKPGSIEFRHVLADPATGYAYEYRKTVSLAGDRAEMVLDHSLRNTGRRAIATSVYNHNFQYLDRQAPGPGVSITVPFTLRPTPPPENSLAVVRGNEITFAKPLTGEDRVYLNLEGFGKKAEDYDIRVEDRRAGVGVRITGDRPMSRLALWAIRAPLSIEPFLDLTIAPGDEVTWKIRYAYYWVR